MAPKSLFLWLYLLIPIILIACAPSPQSSPTADPNVVKTAIASTREAASTATSPASPTTSPTETLTPTPEPTLPMPTLPPATPTTSPSPTASPTPALGGMVAYTNNNDVYLWTEARGPVRLTDLYEVESVRLSDDGELIAFKRQDPDNIAIQELWVVNTKGVPDPRLLVSPDDLAAFLPPVPGPNILGYGVLSYAWRPGTHELAYNTLVLHEGPGFGPNYDLRLVNVDTLEKTTMIDTGQGGIFYYSPNGNQIALSNPDSISLMDADGSNLRANVVTFPSVITYSEYEYTPHPLWAADSGSLRVTIPPQDPLGDPAPRTGLWLIPVNGSPSVKLGSIPAIPFAWPDTAFSFSLELVGYSASSIGPGLNPRDLHIARPDGSEDLAYDSGESLEFSMWSPDSQRFVYKVQGGANEGLYIGDLNGLPVRLDSDPHAISAIRWLGSSRVVYLDHTESRWELRLSDWNGNHAVVIDTPTGASPSFDVLP